MLLGWPLYRLTGWWNVEDLIGHLLSLVCVAVVLYMFLVRFVEGAELQRLYMQWIGRPLTLAMPVMIASWTLADTEEVYHKILENAEPNLWMTLYWIILVGTWTYLLIYAGRILLILRRFDKLHRYTIVLNLYVTTIALMIAFLILFFIHVITPYDLRVPAWTVGYTCVLGWVITPAISWIQKSRPLHIIEPDYDNMEEA